MATSVTTRAATVSPSAAATTRTQRIQWQAQGSELARFAYRYGAEAREESSQLAALHSLQQTHHRLTRRVRLLHGWRQFMVLDDLAWIERNEAWKQVAGVGGEFHTLSTFGAMAPWADFLRLLRRNVRLVAVLGLPTPPPSSAEAAATTTPVTSPSARGVTRRSLVSGSAAAASSSSAAVAAAASAAKSVENERVAIAELLTFSLYGHVAAEREFEHLRRVLRCMTRMEIDAMLDTTGSKGRQQCGFVDYWRTLGTSEKDQPYTLASSDSFNGSLAQPTSSTPALTPRNATSRASVSFTNGPSSPASVAFRSRPLRLIVLELQLRRCCQGGAFLASVLGDPLRALLHDDKRNLDPHESVVAAFLTGGNPSTGTASTPTASSTKDSATSDASPPQKTGFFSAWRSKSSDKSSKSSSDLSTAVQASPPAVSAALTSSVKFRQAVRVTEQLLCTSVDALLDALLHAGPRWPVQVKLLLGDMLRASEERLLQIDLDEAEARWADVNTNAFEGVASSTPSFTSSSSIPYSVAENSILTDETQKMFRASTTTSANGGGSSRTSSAVTTPSSSYRLPSAVGSATAIPTSTSASIPTLQRVGTTPTSASTSGAPTPQPSPAPGSPPAKKPTASDLRAAVLTHILFGLLVLPELRRPHLSGLYLDGALRTRARVNLRVVLTVLEQVLVGRPFDGTHYLRCVNKYVESKARIVHDQMRALAEHCLKLSQEKVDFAVTGFVGASTTMATSPKSARSDDEDGMRSRAGTEQQARSALSTPTKAPLTMSLSPLGGKTLASNSRPGDDHGECEEDEDEDDTLATPPLVLHRASVCLSLPELVLLHQALFRQLDHLSTPGTASPRAQRDIARLLALLEPFRRLPTKGSELEWRPSTVLQLDLVDPHVHAMTPEDGSTGEAFPRLTPLTKRIESSFRHSMRHQSSSTASHPPTAAADPKSPNSRRAFDPTHLATLAAQTFLVLPSDVFRSYAGRASDIFGLLSHARHALEVGLVDEWDATTHALAHVGQLEAELKKANAEYFAPPPSEPAATQASAQPPTARRTLSIVGGVVTPRATPPASSTTLSPALNQLLYQTLAMCWSTFAHRHETCHAATLRSMQHTSHTFRRALLALRAEARFLASLTFRNKVLVFARTRRNAAQSIHLARMPRFVLPGGVGFTPIPPQAMAERKEILQAQAQSSSSSSTASSAGAASAAPIIIVNAVPPSLSNPNGEVLITVPNTTSSSSSLSSSSNPFMTSSGQPVFACASIEGFIQSFESWSTPFSKDLPLAAKLLHHVLRALEKAVREDSGLNAAELGEPSPKLIAASAKGSNGVDSPDDAAHSGTHPPSYNSAEEFIDETLFSERLVRHAVDELEHLLCVRLYPHLFPSDRSATSFEDEVFLYKVKGLVTWIEPWHLHLHDVAPDDVAWTRPLAILQQLDHAHSPASKMIVLTKSLKWLSKLLSVKARFRQMDADSTLSGLIFLLVKAQSPRLLSNLLFLETFLPPAKLIGEAAYVLTQWSLASHYISETLSVYDKASLEAELEAQRAAEEERKRARLALRAASHSATPSQHSQSVSVSISAASVRARGATYAADGELLPPGAIQEEEEEDEDNVESTTSTALLNLVAAVSSSGARTPSTRSRAGSHTTIGAGLSVNAYPLPSTSPAPLPIGATSDAAGLPPRRSIFSPPGTTRLADVDELSETNLMTMDGLTRPRNLHRPLATSIDEDAASPSVDSTTFPQTQPQHTSAANSASAAASASSPSSTGGTPRTGAAGRALLSSMQQSKQRTATRATLGRYALPNTPVARVFRSPPLFDAILASLTVAETARISSVSTAWSLLTTHVARRANIAAHAPPNPSPRVSIAAATPPPPTESPPPVPTATTIKVTDLASVAPGNDTPPPASSQ